MTVKQGSSHVIHRACCCMHTDFKFYNGLINKNNIVFFDLLTETTTTTVYINTTY